MRPEFAVDVTVTAEGREVARMTVVRTLRVWTLWLWTLRVWTLRPSRQHSVRS